MRPQLILPIQYLRGFAALAVVWHHAAGQGRAVGTVFSSALGTAGVDVFFVISGFVMMVTTAARPTTPLAFIKNRLVRIAPLYWALTLAMVVLAISPGHLFGTLNPTLLTTALSMLFIPHFSDTRPAEIWPLLVPGWTLNFEMFFYALFAVSLLAKRHAAVVLVLCCVVLVGLGFICGPFAAAPLRTYTNSLMLEFAAGVLIAKLWLQGHLALSPTVALVFLLIGLAFLILDGEEPVGGWCRQGGACLVVAACLCSAAQRREIKSLKLLGDVSFSIYLTHVFSLVVMERLWSTLLPPAASSIEALPFMVMALAGSTLAGLVTHRYLEAPLTAWVRRHVS